MMLHSTLILYHYNTINIQTENHALILIIYCCILWPNHELVVICMYVCVYVCMYVCVYIEVY